jgi:7-keto-8-aminopelargonate synthetase-like enzyme
MDVFQKCRDFDRPARVKAMGLYPFFVPLGGHVGAEMEINGHSLIMLGSNNYLGLTDHPYVMEKAAEAITKYGTGCTGSRFLNGTLDLHIELEDRLASFLGREKVITFSTGFQANLGVISTLAGRGDIIYADRSDHASIIDGSRLSHARVLRYRHNDTGHLRQLLESNSDHGALIVTDGVFSMEGDIAYIPVLADIAEEFGARLLVDDAHGIGAMGAHGRGTAEHLGCEERVDILVGTFSKSFACIGGFAAGPEVVIDYELVEETHRAARRSRNGLYQLGFDVGNSEAPIVPVMIGDDILTFRVWKDLYQQGVFTNPVISPAVPADQAMLRTSYMASHTDDMIDRALDVLARVGKTYGLI